MPQLSFRPAHEIILETEISGENLEQLRHHAELYRQGAICPLGAINRMIAFFQKCIDVCSSWPTFTEAIEALQQQQAYFLAINQSKNQ